MCSYLRFMWKQLSFLYSCSPRLAVTARSAACEGAHGHRDNAHFRGRELWHKTEIFAKCERLAYLPKLSSSLKPLCFNWELKVIIFKKDIIKWKNPFLYLTFKYLLIQQQQIYLIPKNSAVPSFNQSCPLSIRTYWILPCKLSITSLFIILVEIMYFYSLMYSLSAHISWFIYARTYADWQNQNLI